MTEYATSGGGGGPFPASWGRPRGAPQSEERQQWVREQVRHHLAGAPLRQLRKRQIEMLNQLRMAQVERLRREGPRSFELENKDGGVVDAGAACCVMLPRPRRDRSRA